MGFFKDCYGIRTTLASLCLSELSALTKSIEIGNIFNTNSAFNLIILAVKYYLCALKRIKRIFVR